MNRRVVFSILRKDYKPKDGIKEDNPFPEIQLNNDLIEGGGEDGDIDTGDKKNEKTTTMPGGNPDKQKN